MGRAFRFYQHGGPEVLQWEDVDLPPPAAGQVRMRNTAVAVNYRDVLVRRGSHEVRSFPSGIGLESAGVVEAIGPGVTDIFVGDRIACVAGPDGAYAEARNVPAARAVKLPDAIGERTAAAMMIRGMTARYLLHDTYAVKPGDAILVHAAAGGVGLILCQWAKHLGATVIGTVSTEAKATVARSYGCDHAIVYTHEDFAERVKEITNGEGVAVVYDSVGRTTLGGSMRCLRRRGVLASYGEASGDPEPVAPRLLGHMGSIFLTHPSLPDYTATRADLLNTSSDLFAMVMTGKVTIEVNHTYALRDAPQAHADLEARQTTGSIVLVP
jgi:NADPH2:quinone reductase